jgi:hypothetical protein
MSPTKAIESFRDHHFQVSATKLQKFSPFILGEICPCSCPMRPPEHHLHKRKRFCFVEYNIISTYPNGRSATNKLLYSGSTQLVS